jgi:hypothetical protein
MTALDALGDALLLATLVVTAWGVFELLAYAARPIGQ